VKALQGHLAQWECKMCHERVQRVTQQSKALSVQEQLAIEGDNNGAVNSGASRLREVETRNI